MKPTIVDRDRITLVGFGFYGDPFAASGGWTEENEIGRLWRRFMAYLDGHAGEMPDLGSIETSYEVHIRHDETREKGHYEVFVGVEVARLDAVPVQLSVKVLPPTQYAVFTLRGEQIASDWTREMSVEWVPNAGYREAHPYMIEIYDQRFKGLDNLEDSELEIWIPVQRAP